MAEKDTKPNGKETPPATPATFDDSEFFASEGITEDEEKEAIRSRARVARYATWRAGKEAEGKKPAKRKPWYKED